MDTDVQDAVKTLIDEYGIGALSRVEVFSDYVDEAGELVEGWDSVDGHLVHVGVRSLGGTDHLLCAETRAEAERIAAAAEVALIAAGAKLDRIYWSCGGAL